MAKSCKKSHFFHPTKSKSFLFNLFFIIVIIVNLVKLAVFHMPFVQKVRVMRGLGAFPSAFFSVFLLPNAFKELACATMEAMIVSGSCMYGGELVELPWLSMQGRGK